MCSFLVWKNACLNYREFDLEGDPVGVSHTWYLSAQSFITLLKLLFEESRTWLLWMRGKRNVSVCIGHELANALYIYDRYYIRTHVYVFLFSVKKRVFELSRVWPWRWPRVGTSYMVFIGPVFHNTIKTCLKRVWHCGYEWVKNEMCRFAEDMS